MAIHSIDSACPTCDSEVTSHWRGEVNAAGTARFDFQCWNCDECWDEKHTADPYLAEAAEAVEATA